MNAEKRANLLEKGPKWGHIEGRGEKLQFSALDESLTARTPF